MLETYSLFDPYRTRKTRTKKIMLDGKTRNIGPIVAAIGVFDGVHQGHRLLIGSAIMKAEEMGCKSAVITFDRDPDELFASAARGVRHILCDEDRVKLLSTLGADYVIVVPFTRDFSELAPDDFLDGLSTLGIDARALYVGSDFRFGYRAQGTVEVLKGWCEKYGCEVHALDLLCDNRRVVTATRIRGDLERHEIEHANRLLDRTHFIRGSVHKGRGVGKSLGFATANIEPLSDYACIGDGVYAGYALIDQQFYRAAISVGVPSTFGDQPHTIEAHILDFEGELYGNEIALYFVSFMRPMMTFDTPEELIQTVLGNISWTRENLPLPSPLPKRQTRAEDADVSADVHADTSGGKAR